MKTPSYFFCKYARKCNECCKKTEMALSERDIKRIVKLGYEEKEFLKDEDGFKILKNKGGVCFFLKEGKCSIYRHRPQGCKYYPLILDLNQNDFTIDIDCPKHKEFDKNNYQHLYQEILIFVKILLEEKRERMNKKGKHEF